MTTSPVTTTTRPSIAAGFAMARLLPHANHAEPRFCQQRRDGGDGVAVVVLDLLGQILPRDQVRALLLLDVLLGRVRPVIRLALSPPAVVLLASQNLDLAVPVLERVGARIGQRHDRAAD